MEKAPSTSRAFSLIELSIVLVIAGLVIGVIFSSQDLIRRAELRSVITDANSYITAVNNFRQQYRFMPGDAANAESYWSAATTDNGNADGAVTGAERFLAWQHLNLAGFVEKPSTGTQGAGGANDFVIGGNIPAARIPLTGFALYYDASLTTATTTTYAANLGNAFTYGKAGAANSGPPSNAVLNPTDAANIDTKADDGRPGTGKWIANLTGAGDFSTPATTCTTSTSGTDYTGDYRTTVQTAACSFFIMSGY